MSNDSTYYFCSFIVVPSANRFGNQFYWKIVRWRMSQKIAKKHYEEAKTDDISPQHANLHTHNGSRRAPIYLQRLLARSHHPPSRSPPNSRRTLPINSTINWRNLGANESKSEAVYVRMWRGYYIRWAVRCILRGRG